jgi:hypothetical protein
MLRNLKRKAKEFGLELIDSKQDQLVIANLKQLVP